MGIRLLRITKDQLVEGYETIENGQAYTHDYIIVSVEPDTYHYLVIDPNSISADQEQD